MSPLLYYENITLTSLDGDLSVVLYLPYGTKSVLHNNHTNIHNGKRHDDDDNNYYYYYGTRFDHGSMIGSITMTQRRRRRIVKKNQRRRRHVNDSDENDIGADMEEYEVVEEGEGEEVIQQHTFMNNDNLWRYPHNGYWPESGIGMASEFGVGDDGTQCDFQCGYPGVTNGHGIINGILGYNTNHPNLNNKKHDNQNENNNNNQPEFLKIGVGVLIPGTCPACDLATNEYKFNSPYLYAKIPIWTITQQIKRINNISITTIQFIHEAKTSNNVYGYRIMKELYIHPNNSSIIVTTQLYNIGSNNKDNDDVVDMDENNHPDDTTTTTSSVSTSFSTVWYSHNFFTCDHEPIGPGYSIDLDLHGDTIIAQAANAVVTNHDAQLQLQQPSIISGDNTPLDDPTTTTTTTAAAASSSSSSLLYDEPGTWSWSQPISDYATVTSYADRIRIDLQKTIEPGIRIKTEFKNDYQTRGSFTIQACDTTFQSSLSWPEEYNINRNDPPVDNTNNNDAVPNNNNPTIEMYAYNIYIERGTLSPEPQLLFSNIDVGSHVEWTQTISIRPLQDNDDDNNNDSDTDTVNSDEIDIVEHVLPLPQSILPTAWLTNLLPGYNILPHTKRKNHHDDNEIQSSSSSIIIMIAMIISTISVLLHLIRKSSIRLGRRNSRHQYPPQTRRREDYESIA